MVGDPSDDIPSISPGVPGDSPGSVVGTSDAPLELGYTVTVDSFSGPLDLLLYLVRRTELDILEVPLALIVDQFVDTVRSWQDADLDVAGEFILMAATLLELKARTIAPPLEQPEEGAEDEPAFDPRESLLKSLLAYRRFKEASQLLDGLEELRRPLLERQFREHVPEAPPEDTDIDLGEIDLSLLATTCERILSRIGGLGPRTVVVDEMPLGVRIATLLDELSARERMTIRELLSGNHSRVVHITTVMATLELARQRFIEVAQHEQFGDIALRLRSAEERERTPELPPPEPDAPKRRRKLPLVTWHSSAASSDPADDAAEAAAPEEPAETDEQRFLRELEAATRVTAVLALTADVEKSFTEHWYTLHPELRPAPSVAAPSVVPAETSTEAPAKRPPPRRRPPTSEPVVSVASEAAPTNAVASSTVVEAPPITDAPAMISEAAPGVVGEPAVVPAASAPAADLLTAQVPRAVEPSTISAVAVELEPASPVVVPQEPITVPVLPPAVESTPAAAPESVPVIVVPISEPPVSTVVVSDASSVTPATVEAPAEPPVAHARATPTEPSPTPQVVLPVEHWPVLHAMPAPEETPHPLDTVASDDPAAVNALLAGATPRHAPADEESDEDEDPDDLLADDPALVNAALQLDTPRPHNERRAVPEVIIPAATETTVWTAPVDRGQTADVAEDEAPVAAEHEVADSAPVAAQSPVPVANTVEVPPASDPPLMMVRQPSAADAPSDTIREPTPSTEPLRLLDSPVVAQVDEDLLPDEPAEEEGALAPDPALVDAAHEADVPHSVALHPIHELTIPTATETTVWTAPVDRGQTAAVVDDEEDDPSDERDAASATVAVGENVAPVVVAESVTVDAPSVVVASPEPVSAAAVSATADMQTPIVDSVPIPVVAASVSEPTPTTAPLVLTAPEPVVAPLSTDTASAPPEPLPVAVVPLAEPPPPDGPPPPPPRADSPLPAPTTTPTPKRPMSPPPRSKAWPLIALIVAINAVWAGWTWLAWVPRDVLEVAATERGGTPEQETLTWRFNLDVVDATRQAQAPELVPVISPAVPGRWHWSGPRTLVFEAAGPLPLATSFIATLAPERFRTVQGFRLHAAAEQRWSTAALSIQSAVIETFDHTGTTIALSFNQPVDPVVIAQRLAIELSPSDPTSPGRSLLTEESITEKPVASTVIDEAATPSVSPASAAEVPPVIAKTTDSTVPAAATTVPSPAVPVVRAISTAPGSTVRLLLATSVRGTAVLRLPAGTVGVAGALGLDQAWEQRVPLQQTLQVVAAHASVPSHGAVRVDVTVSDPAAPRELLAPVVMVEPPLPVTISTTDTGLSLIGDFVPGQIYRISAAATWPDEPGTSGHVLAAYTAASAVNVSIPERPPGIWPRSQEIVDGRVQVAAHAVTRADVMLVSAEDECVASRELTWESGTPATLDVDDLVQDQAPASYHVRFSSGGEMPTVCEQAMVIEQVHVRPQALFAAFTDWALAAMAGNEDADVPLRVVRLAASR